MTIEEFKAALSTEEIEAVKAAAAKTTDLTGKDKDIFVNYIKKASEALGEDLIAEPVRYVVSSMGGLRKEDLQFLIGEDFDAEAFDIWNNLLETPILPLRKLTADTELYDIAPPMRDLIRKSINENDFRSCAADIGYYLLEHKAVGDIIRDTQTMHLLLDGNEAAAAAEYLSESNGNPLSIAVRVLAQGMVDAPESVKATIWDMTRAQGEKIDITKIFHLLLNDCIAVIGNPEKTKPLLDKIHALVGEAIKASGIQLTTPADMLATPLGVLYGMAKLRIAQNARMRHAEEEAQKVFVAAINYIMPPLQQADPASISAKQISQFWLCLKICQEMAQPKAMTVIFEQIIRIERAQTQDENRSEEERGQIAEDIIGQHIDMSKLYYSMPQQLQEQFTNYTESTLALLNSYIGAEKTENENKNTERSDSDSMKLSGFYQALGELSLRLERYDESYDALTQAQILQMHLLASMQKQDGQDRMSPQQLLCRLALSATNHMIAAHYRRKGKNLHDLGIVLRSNMNIAEDCFKFYPRDAKVIHFFINAALELGDYQHQSRGLLAECGTYEKVVRQFGILNNMNLDQQLANDIAMILTKCGQVQADKSIRRYKEAIRNLETAHQLWKSMADNTKNPNFQNNATAVQNMLRQLKGNK